MTKPTDPPPPSRMQTQFQKILHWRKNSLSARAPWHKIYKTSLVGRTHTHGRTHLSTCDEGTRTRVHMQSHLHTYVQACMNACTQALAYKHTRLPHECARTHTSALVHTYTWTSTRMYKCTHVGDGAAIRKWIGEMQGLNKARFCLRLERWVTWNIPAVNKMLTLILFQGSRSEYSKIIRRGKTGKSQRNTQVYATTYRNFTANRWNTLIK